MRSAWSWGGMLLVGACAPDAPREAPGDDASDTARPPGEGSQDDRGDDTSAADTDKREDTSSDVDTDPPAHSDEDTDTAGDTDGSRVNLWPAFCPSSDTPEGLYEGTLASNLNDIASNGCTGASPGRDGAVRVSLAPGEAVNARYRHGGDGILYVLGACPVASSCLEGDAHGSGGEAQVRYVNTTGGVRAVYVVLDSEELGGPQTFELDLWVD